MRLFEIVILLLLIPYLIWPLFSRPRPRRLQLLPPAALAGLILHLVWEGYRWQMVPAYGLVVVTALNALRQLRRPSSADRSDKKAIWLSLGGISWLLVAFFPPIALPVPTFQPPGGPYAIGTTTRHLVDAARPEIYTTDPADSREIMVQLWYPTDTLQGYERASYLDPLDVIGPILARRFNLPGFALNHINLAETYAVIDPPIAQADTPYPVIIFSHGLGAGVRSQNTGIVNELVSHGYVVGAIDHTYANAATVFPDGRVTTYEPEKIFPSGDLDGPDSNRLLNVWAADIAFLLDEMSRWQTSEGHIFAGQLDLEKVGIFGHSTGGGTTLEFCWQDSRCRAGVALDSWVNPVSAGFLEQPPDVPFMFINSPEWLRPANKSRGQQIVNRLPADHYLLTLADTDHYDFSDLSLLTPLTPQLGLTGTIDAEYSVALQAEYILAFFNTYLKSEGSPLLQQPSPYPELTVER